MKKIAAENQLLGYCSNDLEKLHKFIDNYANHHRLTGSDKCAFFVLRNVYWEEKRHAKAMGYAVRNWELPLDYLIEKL